MNRIEQIYWQYMPRGVSAIAITMIVGGLTYYHADQEPDQHIFLFAAICTAVIGVFAYAKQNQLVSHGAIVALSMLLGVCYAQYRTQNLLNNLGDLTADKQVVLVQGRVIDQEFLGGDSWRITLDDITFDQKSIKGKVRIRTDDFYHRGTVIRILSQLYRPSQAVVEGGFDFSEYAFFQELVAVGYGKYPADIISLNEGDDFFHQARLQLYSSIDRDFDTETASVLRALILGDRQSLSDTQSEEFRRSGLAHLLAISGMHIGMITFLVFISLKRIIALHLSWSLRFSIHIYAACASLIVAYGYIALTGGAVSMYRAFIMIAIFMLALMLERDSLRYRSLSLAAIFLFILRPSVVLEAGFLLSFTAVLVLIGYRENRQLWIDSIEFFPKLLRQLVEVFVGSLLISIITAPLIWGIFQQFYPLSALSNVLAVPWFGLVVMPLILIYAVFSFIGFSSWIAALLEPAIKAILRLAEYFASFEVSAMTLPILPTFTMFVSVSIGLIILLSIDLRWYLRFGAILSLFASYCFFYIHAVDPVFAMNRNDGAWAIISEEGIMLGGKGRLSSYERSEWQKTYNKPLIPWQADGQRNGLVWSCREKGCQIAKNNLILKISFAQNCQEQSLSTIFVHKSCISDRAYGLDKFIVTMEEGDVQVISSPRNRIWHR